MQALRWILLLAGLVFLALLAAWELRRPRAGRRDEHQPRSEPQLGGMESGTAERAALSSRVPSVSESTRRSRLEPPLVQIAAEDSADESAAEPAMTEALDVESIDLPPIEAEAVDEAVTPRPAVVNESDEPTDEVKVPQLEPAPVLDAATVAQAPAASLIVEWPPEAERQILTLRVTAQTEERLAGRALRQALSALGFVYGRFGIFHQPGAHGHALISAASLSAPGVFDLSSMDFQRFAGLSMFVVLPGPLPPAEAFDHLLDAARELATRLHARVQDERGEPLDASRLEALRTRVRELPAAISRAEPAA
jgi:FtsZ-interacting cell division protein ZipA